MLKKVVLIFTVPVLLLCIVSCNAFKHSEIAAYDAEIGILTRDEFERRLIHGNEKKVEKEPEQPKLSKVMVMPSKPKITEDKYITVSSTEDVALRDLLMEIANLAEIDVSVDKEISGSVIFNAKNRKLTDVLDRLCDTADLRYHEKNGMLFFEKDIPFTKHYGVGFLDITRSGSSSVNVSTSTSASSSGESGGSSGSLGGGASSSISSQNSDSFWEDIDANIRLIAGSSDNIDVKFNKQAGIVSVSTTEKIHKKVDKYLAELKRRALSQVLIEVKIVEITLNKLFDTGVQWNTVFGRSSVTSPFATVGEAASSGATYQLSSAELPITLKSLERFGTSRVLSSPIINALNNQPTVLTFADNKVYFKVEFTSPPAVANGGTVLVQNTTVKSTAMTIPIGIVMAIHPSIDIDRREILLNVRPTITRSDSSVSDPGVTYMATKNAEGASGKVTEGIVSNQIPVTKTRELDSIMKIKDGDVMVMGGFIERANTIDEQGIPFLSRIPLLGWLFKTKTVKNNVIETVIFIKATIIEDSNVTDNDRNIYNNFIVDPRRASL